MTPNVIYYSQRKGKKPKRKNTAIGQPEMTRRKIYIYKGVKNMKTTTTKKNRAKRTLAGILAAFTMVTAAVPSFSAVMSVSAAETKQDFDFKGMGIEAVDAGFDTIAQLIPGGKILLSPFKSLFHGAVDGENPMTLLDSKLDQIDGKLDEISKQIDDLGKRMDSNIRYLENISDMKELRSYYQNMKPYVEILKRKVMAIEKNNKLSNEQKAVQLAAMLKDNAFTQVWVNVFHIKECMANENPNVYTSMFDTLYKNASTKRMFSKEAYDDAKAVADDLSAQYLFSAGLLAECQTAFEAVLDLDEAQTAGFDVYELSSYNEIMRDQINLSFYNNDTLFAVAACVKGYQDFEKYNNYNFIDKGAQNKTWGLSYDTIYHSGQTEYSVDTMKSRQPASVGHIKDVIAESKTSRFTYDEIKRIADYVKVTYPGTSLYDFLRKMGNPYIGPWHDGSNISHAYIVIDGKVNEDSVYDPGTSWGNEALGNKFYDKTKYVNCIDLFDTNCSTTKVEVGRYYTGEEWLFYACLKTHIFQYDNYNAPSNIFVHFNVN